MSMFRGSVRLLLNKNLPPPPPPPCPQGSDRRRRSLALVLTRGHGAEREELDAVSYFCETVMVAKTERRSPATV
ncbi:unnamed protein product [Spodoptera exigua]|nr:unnamed protein product [Spodoptera exigua]